MKIRELASFVAWPNNLILKRSAPPSPSLLRIVEKEGIKSETDLLKIAEDEDAAVRDRFKLRNLKSARAFKEILLRVTKRD